jgi:hypothetical protein
MDARRRPRTLPPLQPEAYLVWLWRTGARPETKAPPTIDDFWFAWGPGVPGFTLEETRRTILHLAARSRRNVRLGLDPITGTVS